MAIQILGLALPVGVVMALIGLFTNKYFLVFLGIALLAIGLSPAILGASIAGLFIKLPWYIYGIGLLLLIFIITKKK